MTMIAMYGNTSFVVVAADRRLTYPSGEVFADNSTKLLFWFRGIIFGFTGQAFLSRHGKTMPTMEWFAHVLSDTEKEVSATGKQSIDMQAIANRLNNVFLPGDKRLAIGGIGYWAGKTPTSILFSNMHDDQGHPQPIASKEFHYFYGNGNGEVLNFLGGTPEPKDTGSIIAQISRVATNPVAIAQILAGVIERTAGPLIGNQALYVYIKPTDGKKENRRAKFGLISPGLMRPGVLTDFASPIFVGPAGVIMAMPPQQARLSPKRVVMKLADKQKDVP